VFKNLLKEINYSSNRIGATLKPTNETKKKLRGSEREPPLSLKSRVELSYHAGEKYV
jgi:hypothetical protein